MIYKKNNCTVNVPGPGNRMGASKELTIQNQYQEEEAKHQLQEEKNGCTVNRMPWYRGKDAGNSSFCLQAPERCGLGYILTNTMS